jgi:hypothetical protein
VNVTEGCRGSEFFMKRKTLIAQKEYTGCSTDRPRTYTDILLVGRVHTCAALLKGHIPVDRLVSIKD